MKQDNHDLEEMIQRAYNDVHETYCHPPLHGPRLIWDKINESGEGTAFLNLMDRKVSINVPFVLSLAAEGLASPETMARGLLTHEMGHYFFFPRTLSQQLFLSFQAYKYFSSQARGIYTSFSELVNNTVVARQDLHREELTKALQATYNKSEKTPLQTVLWRHYAGIMNFDLSPPEYTPEIQEKIDLALKEIRELVLSQEVNYSLQSSQLQRFGQAILPLVDESPPLQCGSGGMMIPEIVVDLPADKQQEVREALRALIRHIPKKLYHELERHFFPREESARRTQSLGIGTSFTEETIADAQTVEYYREAAKQYGIYIRPRRGVALSTTDIVFGKREFQAGRGTRGLDIRYSGGKILPGLTTMERMEKIIYPANREITPNLLLYKDASGTMPKPMESTCPGTIAGAILVLSYRRSGAAVGIALFDSETTEVMYSLNENELLAKLCGYKGGGTAVDIEKLKKDLAEQEKSFLPPLNLSQRELREHPLMRKYLIKEARVSTRGLQVKQFTDFVIITDGGIANLDELTAFFRENQVQYRPTIIHTGDFSLDIPGYDQATAGTYGGITVYKANTREEIIAMTKKAARKNLLE